MDALKETRLRPSKGFDVPSGKAPACVPTPSPAGSERSWPASPAVAKYYTVLPVPAEPAPENEDQKQAGKARNTNTTAVTAPEPRIVNLAWTRNVKREERNLLTGT